MGTVVPSRAEVIASLLNTVTEVQTASGRPVDGLNESTGIYDGIDGFDSLNALELLVMVGATLGNEFPEQLLAPAAGTSSLTLGVLADRILARLEGKI